MAERYVVRFKDGETERFEGSFVRVWQGGIDFVPVGDGDHGTITYALSNVVEIQIDHT